MKLLRKKIWIRAAWIGFVTLIVAAPFINMRWNHWKLQRLARQMEYVGHSPGTRLVKSVQFLGITHGTGNQCDFLVAQLRSYQGNEKELKAFYRAQRAKAPDGEVIPVEVAVWKGTLFDDQSFDWMNQLNVWFSPQMLDDQQLYVVYINAGGYEPCLDIRCH